MKIRRALLLVSLTALLAGAGCKNFGQYIDTNSRATGGQVLRGSVNLPPGLELPADAVLTVRLLDLSRDGLPFAEQTVEHPGASPVPFEINYKADDLQTPHRVRIEARLSFGGRLRLISNRTSADGLVTPENASLPILVNVTPLTGAAP